MKAKKLSIGLVTAFVAALSLTACNEVTADGSKIITLKGYDGSTLVVDADSIYSKYKSSDDGVSSFYTAILEVLIRDYFNADAQATKLAELKSKAKTKVEGVRETASSNASKNGTDYNTELNNLLENTYHVEDEDELYEYFLYQLEKDEYDENYLKNDLSSLTEEYIGFKQEGNLWIDTKSTKHQSVYPYHIRHILVKTSASNENYVTSEITSTEAQNLSIVYQMLESGNYTFGQVAYQKSEDGSNTTYGDAGIMDTTTSFVNEFKLGTYAFDAVYASNVTGNTAYQDKKDEYFGLANTYEGTKTVAEKLEEFQLGEIHFEVFNRLGEIYEEEKSDAGLSVNDGVAKYFPRNVYWNYFLNNHGVSVIVDNGQPLGDGDAYAGARTLLTSSGKCGYRAVKFADGKVRKVLTDELGRVIYVVKSSYGIHFMIMQRTPFEQAGTITGRNAEGAYTYNNTTIAEYYTTKVPGETGYPTLEDGSAKITYVNYLNADTSTYNSRASTVKSDLKGFDANYEYRMFEELLKNKTIEIKDETVKKELLRYIENKRIYAAYSANESTEESWKDYLDQLTAQKAIQSISYKELDAQGKEMGEEMHRYVNLVCARKFKTYSSTGADWIKGGACYYAK